jgi:hypothetical protein
VPRQRLPVVGIAAAILVVAALVGGGIYTFQAGKPQLMLAAAITGQGTVSLAIAPWGEVLVDGKNVGVSPPLTELPLPAGRHKVEVRNGNFPSFSLEFDLQAGDSRKIKHKF